MSSALSSGARAFSVLRAFSRAWPEMGFTLSNRGLREHNQSPLSSADDKRTIVLLSVVQTLQASDSAVASPPSRLLKVK